MTKAELRRRLVVGTKLTLVDNLMGPCRKLRTVIAIRSTAILMDQHDPEKIGRPSRLYLDQPRTIEDRENGFAIFEDGELVAAYEWGHNV